MTEARRALVTAGVALLVVALFVLALWVAEVLLLAFAGILLALLLRGIADWLAARAPVSPGLALAAVVVSLVALVGVGGRLLADELASQFDQLVAQVPQAWAAVREQIAQYAWGRSLLARLPAAESLASSGTLARATGLLSTTLGTTIGLVANLVIVVFVALYVAADPGVYTRGVVRLVPRAGRDRAREVLGVLGHTLRRWLVGKLLAMVVIGVFTGGGLWLIGVPLALMLGVLAGLLNFVPYLGPVLAFLPAALLALTTSPVTAL